MQTLCNYFLTSKKISNQKITLLTISGIFFGGGRGLTCKILFSGALDSCLSCLSSVPHWDYNIVVFMGKNRALFCGDSKGQSTERSEYSCKTDFFQLLHPHSLNTMHFFNKTLTEPLQRSEWVDSHSAS